jgi:addiction module HigA family antidote
MIVNFSSKQTELIFQGKISRRYPEHIQLVALRLLRIIDAATSIIDLQILPRNCLEKRSDDLGQYSCRIYNSGWRICFIWTVQNDATDVEIVRDFDMTKRKRLPNVHPGEILQLDFLDPMQITVDRFSADIGVTQSSISQILNGERGITVDIALKFAGYFGNSDSPKERLRQRFWLNLQTQYDAAKTQELYYLKAMDILDRIVPGEEDDDDDDDDDYDDYDYERIPSVRRRSRIDRQTDRDWLDDDFQKPLDEWSRFDRYDAPDRSERLSGERRDRAKQGRRVSDFQTIEVNGKLVISVEDLIAAGVIFLE